MGKILTMPHLSLREVCAPSSLPSETTLLAVHICDDSLADDGYLCGEWAVAVRNLQPDEGHLAAIEIAAGTIVGYVHFPVRGGIEVYGSSGKPHYYAPGTFRILGAVKRICRAGNHCRCSTVETPHWITLMSRSSAS